VKNRKETIRRIVGFLNNPEESGSPCQSRNRSAGSFCSFYRTGSSTSGYHKEV